MNIGPANVTELFHHLESNKLGEVEEIKKVFHDIFLCSKYQYVRSICSHVYFISV